ncbi:alkylated DNA repair protein (DNA oxidative demethylase) [Palleronia salina]|uniref:Alkylated DNA repair protein (DNA oxidative demethylase) n=1 Tax=Palleronia salina TaxID=313368 RepID=A0A1M6CPG1_9RHOB|nr:alpha-ketoglutarate-dependent dioxygenase AlkB [Palleronia salina]SHI62793.1 alkylated DNA repair protein (DNA oxidative demethylase) [Palleronia salina]
MDLNGVTIHPGALDHAAQEALVADLRDVVSAAPLFHPETSRGRKMSVRMTSAGALGWVSDRRGYRYEPAHPSGVAWPPIPDRLLALWDRLADCATPPDTCLINFYGEGARMGLHQDRDEASFDFPVLSLSLGDDALFRVGGTERGGRTKSVWLSSGDVAVIGGDARLAYHGIDRTRFGSSSLLPQGGRINVTLRVAGVSAAPPS